ncbi:rhomboid family intramembrane serine protease [Aliiruegeria lutimaris]|nr:rhomboid family intramembrane serine protease [Aliiruegeria lutimaris]
MFRGSNLRNLLLGYGAFWPDLLHGSQPVIALQPALMFVTYGFLHGGLLHLVFNMMTLWMLGRIVIGRSGALQFAVIYFLSLLGGGAGYGLLHSGGWPMVGASGALFGLAGTILLWVWRAQPSLAASLAATWKVFAFLLLYNVVMYVALAGGLAWEAHLGGFLAGWIVAWIWPRRGPKGVFRRS